MTWINDTTILLLALIIIVASIVGGLRGSDPNDPS